MSNIPWYHKTTIYQIYPRSFYDSNSDDIRKAKLLAMLQLTVRGVPDMPVHENYTAVNVERESKDEGLLLNTVRTLLKLRNHEKGLREGSLDILDNLPNSMLGYARKVGNEKIVVLLNFGGQEKEFQIESSECIFKLSGRDSVKEKAIRLEGFGGMIIK